MISEVINFIIIIVSVARTEKMGNKTDEIEREK